MACSRNFPIFRPRRLLTPRGRRGGFFQAHDAKSSYRGPIACPKVGGMNAPTDPGALQRAERQSQVVRALQAVLPSHALLWQAEDTTPYECDGLTAYRQRPLVVALPENEREVQAVLQVCHALDVPVVARGAGTGLSGGAMPTAMGVTLSLAKFNRILRLDPQARTATVECGVRNLAISEAAAPYGLYYA